MPDPGETTYGQTAVQTERQSSGPSITRQKRLISGLPTINRLLPYENLSKEKDYAIWFNVRFKGLVWRVHSSSGQTHEIPGGIVHPSGKRCRQGLKKIVLSVPRRNRTSKREAMPTRLEKDRSLRPVSSAGAGFRPLAATVRNELTSGRLERSASLINSRLRSAIPSDRHPRLFDGENPIRIGVVAESDLNVV